ncbi:sigma-70 family RNA polymerase sigma factor [Arthrobacter sp. Br18]|uniref:sigma-70 family RNA polymerase sigma factor n=1 Tax=Arthrobacter sp. Br18 TaxID=1312954 RepID=UPI00047DD201|nr:sigma-70 family RNA polymerase sigma factor [Arthrobacter sp. Br18]
MSSSSRLVSDPDTTMQTLIGLIGRVGNRDEAAFEALYERTARRVYGLALRVLQNPAMAAEVAQEVYLLVWTTAATYDPSRGSPQSWLFTLTHRRAVDRVRSEQSSRERGARHMQETNALKVDSVEETVHHTIMSETIRACLATLTARQAEAVTLAYYDGLTYVQVADRLGLKLPTAKSRIQSGLARLRTAMEQQGYDAQSR